MTSIQKWYRRFAAFICGVILAGIMALPGTALADPSQPVSVQYQYDVPAGIVLVQAKDGVAESAWNVSLEVVGSAGTTWIAMDWDPAGKYWSTTIPVEVIGGGYFTVTAYALVNEDPGLNIGSFADEVIVLNAQARIRYDEVAKNLELLVWDVSNPGGVNAISVGITTPSDMNKWVELKSSGTGAWRTTLDPLVFGYEPGVYVLDVAISDSNWKAVDAGTFKSDVNYGPENVWVNSDHDTLRVSTTGPRAEAATAVDFVVTGKQGTFTEKGTHRPDGSWDASLPFERIGRGDLDVRPVFTVGTAPKTTMKPVTYTIAESFKMDATLRYDPVDLTLNIDVLEVDCPGGCASVSAGLTAPDGSVRWIELNKYPNGYWSAPVYASDLGWQSGLYGLEVAAHDKAWNLYKAGEYPEAFNPWSNEFVFIDGVGRLVGIGSRPDVARSASFDIVTMRGGVERVQAVYDEKAQAWVSPALPQTTNILQATMYLNVAGKNLTSSSLISGVASVRTDSEGTWLVTPQYSLLMSPDFWKTGWHYTYNDALYDLDMDRSLMTNALGRSLQVYGTDTSGSRVHIALQCRTPGWHGVPGMIEARPLGAGSIDKDLQVYLCAYYDKNSTRADAAALLDQLTPYVYLESAKPKAQ